MIVLAEIVVPPCDVYGVKYPPLALACLAGALKNAGEQSQIVLFRFGDDSYKWVNQVLALQPQVVGFSVLVGFKLKMALHLSRLLKQLQPDLPILWGGVHPSLEPEQCLYEPSIDWICVGPGESTIVAIAQMLHRNIGIEQVPSLAYRNNGKVVINPPGIPGIDSTIERPDWESFPVQEFVFSTNHQEKIIGFICSRGCPFNCGFCYNKAFHGRHWQPSDITQIQKEMQYLRSQYSINSFLFLDDCFLGNKKRAIELLQWMSQNGFICYAVDLRVNQIDYDIIDTLHTAGIRSVFIGIESSSERILQLITKGFGVEDIERAMVVLKKYPDILVLLSFIVGFPTESFQEIKETISTCAKLCLHRSNTLIALNTYLPLPGTALFKLSLQHGFKEPKNLADWIALNVDAYGSSKLDYFPGRFTATEIRYIQRAILYLRMLYRPYITEKLKSIRRCVAEIFRYIAIARLHYHLLWFPVDIWIYNILRRLLQSKT
ncbi:MAG: radical SAM protein [bacterium]